MPIAILGPTASGKSALGVAVAARLGGTVVNGDPFQAIAGLGIGTGQPSEAERVGVPHVGYGALPITYRPNPADFGGRVRTWLAQVPNPVLVTGSGLYLRGIWNQLTELPDVPEPVTMRVRGWGERLGAPCLHRFLRAVDPVRAAELHPNDGSRIQRALALHLATGRRPSELLTGIERGLPEGWRGLVVLPTRERLRARVARRVRAMAEAGWRAEALAAPEAELRELRPLGYVEWLDGGELEAVLAAITAATQAYAKRQETFFRRQWPELPTWDPDTEPLEVAFGRIGV